MRKLFLAIILLSAVSVWSADKLQPLNVKPGLWECTLTTVLSGQAPIAPEMLSRLNPEQRARLEEQMKAGMGAHKHVYKSCVTKEDLAKGEGFADKKECTQKVLKSTADELDLNVSCNEEGSQGKGTIHLMVVNPESVKGKGQMSISASGTTMNSDATFSSKWVGSACGDVQ